MSRVDDLKSLIAGDVTDAPEELDKHSRDTSLFRVQPEVVVYPRSVADVEAVVRYVNDHKHESPRPTITGRAGGSDMSGGPLNESIILNVSRYLNGCAVDEPGLRAIVEPGLFYRDFEKEILPEDITLPSFPASKNLAALGGMIMNNSAGEKTLRYGQTRNFTERLWMVMNDGNQYEFGKLTAAELEAKKAQANHEGYLYRELHQLIQDNYELIQQAKPATSKNSAGYALWEVWNKATGEFDMSQLFVGSQGTLGLLTRAELRLVKEKSHRKLVALFFKSWDDLPQVVNALLPHEPEELEVFDDATLKLGLRFMPEIAKRAHSSFVPFALRFLPEAWMGVKMLGMPKLIVLAEFAEDSEAELQRKVAAVTKQLKRGFRVWYRVVEPGPDSEKYWIMRRESFNLLRQHVAGKRTVPLVEDFCVPPSTLPEFLPQALSVLKKYGIKANVAGHAGNGNLHIIPLMDLTKESERAKLVPAATEFYELVTQYGGTITAEHNDGILRTPFLPLMYGEEMAALFARVKEIFDPHNIFNPGKKVGGSLEYFKAHLDSGK